MDKLGCSIKTLSPTEVAHFRIFLRAKAKSKNSKKEKLFEYLLAGKQSNHIKNRLYDDSISDNAYYQLRSALMVDVESFLVIEQFNKQPSAHIYGWMLLANRASCKAHSELARHYYELILENNASESLKKEVNHAMSLLTDIDFDGLLIEFKSDVKTMDLPQLLAKFSFSFFTSLKKNDLLHFINKINYQPFEENFAETNTSYNEMFVRAYCKYIQGHCDDALIVLNKIIQRTKLDPLLTVKVRVWANLLKAFVQAKKGLVHDSSKQLCLLKNDLFPVVGTQYKLIILRWSLVLHVQQQNTEQATANLNIILNFKEKLIFYIGKNQLLKLLVFAVHFSEQKKNDALLEKAMLTGIEICNLPCELPLNSDLHKRYMIMLLDAAALDIAKTLHLKTPENILFQMLRSSSRLPRSKNHGRRHQDNYKLVLA